jgi:hypothetical protein
MHGQPLCHIRHRQDPTYPLTRSELLARRAGVDNVLNTDPTWETLTSRSRAAMTRSSAASWMISAKAPFMRCCTHPGYPPRPPHPRRSLVRHRPHLRVVLRSGIRRDVTTVPSTSVSTWLHTSCHLVLDAVGMVGPSPPASDRRLTNAELSWAPCDAPRPHLPQGTSTAAQARARVRARQHVSLLAWPSQVDGHRAIRGRRYALVRAVKVADAVGAALQSRTGPWRRGPMLPFGS